MRSYTLLVLSIMCLFSGSVFAIGGDMGGPTQDGSADFPYLIEDFNDFQAFCTDPNYWVAEVHTRLDCDLDLDPNLPGRIIYTTAVIAADMDSSTVYFQGTEFTGIFDGNSFEISGLTINDGGAGNDYLGLIGRVGSNGKVINLGIENCLVSGGDSCYSLGGLCGYNKGVITDCYATSSISGGVNSWCLGGLCGMNWGGTITKCYATANVSGNSDVGGLCGYNQSGTITKCYAMGNVSGDSDIGGLCGYNPEGIITECYATTRVTGDERLGGLCGWNANGTITNCFWDVETSETDIAYTERTATYPDDVFIPIYSTTRIAEGKTTTEMQTVSTFATAGWVIADYQTGRDGWYMIDGSYPRFVFQNPNAVVIPDVRTKSSTEAQTILTEAGITIGDIYYVESWQTPANTVAGVSGVIGGYIDQNSVSLDIYISNGTTGDGSAANPYEIASQADLEAVNSSPDANYIMTTNVYMDFSAYSQAVISPDTDNSNYSTFDGTAFTGSFNGNGFKISALTIDDNGVDNYFLGLFGCIGSGAKVYDLGIENCLVSGREYLGGLVGGNGEENYNFGGAITNCYATGNISGENQLGGLCGRNYYGTITDCYATATVSGGFDSDHLGGLCGYNYGTITDCYATATVLGGVDSGGLGGLCGKNKGTIANSYATGNISAREDSGFFGGICGYNENGIITNCYATASVSGDEYLGGICGYNWQGTITNCFWDFETSGIGNAGDDNYGAIAKTTPEMKTVNTFLDAGWDFINSWGIGQGQTYPYLRKYSAADISGDGVVNFVDMAIIADNWLGGI